MKKLDTYFAQIRIDGGGIHAPTKIKLGKSDDNVLIIWTITDSDADWSFTDDGIVIKRNYGQFIAPKRSNRREFRWQSQNTNTKYYDYTITVTNGATVSSLDPGIQNGGRK